MICWSLWICLGWFSCLQYSLILFWGKNDTRLNILLQIFVPAFLEKMLVHMFTKLKLLMCYWSAQGHQLAIHMSASQVNLSLECTNKHSNRMKSMNFIEFMHIHCLGHTFARIAAPLEDMWCEKVQFSAFTVALPYLRNKIEIVLKLELGILKSEKRNIFCPNSSKSILETTLCMDLQRERLNI